MIHNAGMIGLIVVHDVIVCIVQLHVRLDALTKWEFYRVPGAQVYVFETVMEKASFAGQAEVFGVEQNLQSPLQSSSQCW